MFRHRHLRGLKSLGLLSRLHFSFPIAALRAPAVTAALCCPVGASQCSDPSAIAQLYDFSPLKPPSTLLHPAAMIVVYRRNPIVSDVLCGPRASLGADWVPMVSRTMSALLNKVEGHDIEMEASLIENIRGRAAFRSIKKISMSLSNASITQLTDIDVEENLSKRSDSCKEVIRRRLEADFNITMVQSALSATVVYTIIRDDAVQMEAKAKIEQMSQLAIQLGGGATALTETTIKAEGLVWGIRDSEYLAAMSIPEVDHTLVDPEARNFYAQDIAHINPVPEAPVVLPHNYNAADEVWLPDAQTGGYRVKQPLPMRPGGAPAYDLRSPTLPREDLNVRIFDDIEEARDVLQRGASLGL